MQVDGSKAVHGPNRRRFLKEVAVAALTLGGFGLGENVCYLIDVKTNPEQHTLSTEQEKRLRELVSKLKTGTATPNEKKEYAQFMEGLGNRVESSVKQSVLYTGAAPTALLGLNTLLQEYYKNEKEQKPDSPKTPIVPFKPTFI